MAWLVYLSCVNMNSMSCMARSGVGINGPVWVMIAPCMYRLSGHNCAFCVVAHAVEDPWWYGVVLRCIILCACIDEFVVSRVDA